MLALRRLREILARGVADGQRIGTASAKQANGNRERQTQGVGGLLPDSIPGPRNFRAVDLEPSPPDPEKCTAEPMRPLRAFETFAGIQKPTVEPAPGKLAGRIRTVPEGTEQLHGPGLFAGQVAGCRSRETRLGP